MEYLYGALLLHKAGQKVTEENLTKTLKAAGVKVEDAKVKATVTALKDVDIDKTIKETAISATPVASNDKKPEEKKTEEKEEGDKKEKEDKGKSEEEAAEGLGALFG